MDAKENSRAGTRDVHWQDAPVPLNPSLDAARRGEPAQPAAPAPAPAEQIQSTISAHWDQVRHTSPTEVRLDLHPPELGRVQLHLALDEGHMNVRMVVQNDAAKRLLDLEREPLRARFSEMGISVGRFDVRTGGGSPNQKQAPASDPSAQAVQTEKKRTAGVRKAYAQLAKPNAAVDVIA